MHWSGRKLERASVKGAVLHSSHVSSNKKTGLSAAGQAGAHLSETVSFRVVPEGQPLRCPNPCNPVREPMPRRLRSVEELTKFPFRIVLSKSLKLLAKNLPLRRPQRVPDSDPLFMAGGAQEIDYNEFLIDISSIVDKMTNIVLIGKISHISPVNQFIKKDQSIGRVASFNLHDLTGMIRVVVWDEQTDFLKSEFFKEGKILQVINAYSKLNRSDKI